MMRKLKEIKHLVTNQMEVLFQMQMKIEKWSVQQKVFDLLGQNLGKSIVALAGDNPFKNELPQELILFDQR